MHSHAASSEYYLRIIECHTRAQRALFCDVRNHIYRAAPNFVPDILENVRRSIDVKRNPFFRHADAAFWIALSSTGEPIGRIAGLIDRNRLSRYPSEGLFGFFDCAEGGEPAESLLDTVATWLRRNGMRRIVGPISPSIHQEVGFLADGFDQPPSALLQFNGPWYKAALERLGFEKVIDAHCYKWRLRNSAPSEAVANYEAKLKSEGVHLRRFRISDFDRELEWIYQLYNEAWENNWGMTPIEWQEFRHVAKPLRHVLCSEVMPVLERDGRVLGFSAVLPDLPYLLSRLGARHMNLWTSLRFWWNMTGRRRMKWNRRGRVFMTGLLRAAQGQGLAEPLHWIIREWAISVGMEELELSWVLETNKAAIGVGRRLGVELSKVYRVVGRPL